MYNICIYIYTYLHIDIHMVLVFLSLVGEQFIGDFLLINCGKCLAI